MKRKIQEYIGLMPKVNDKNRDLRIESTGRYRIVCLVIVSLCLTEAKLQVLPPSWVLIHPENLGQNARPRGLNWRVECSTRCMGNWQPL